MTHTHTHPYTNIINILMTPTRENKELPRERYLSHGIQ